MVYVLDYILQICWLWVQIDLLPSSFVLNWLNLETATFTMDNTDGIWAEFEMADSRECKIGNCSIFREA